MNASPSSEAAPTLGTYVGVFRPTLLTIVGVVLYLREGYVVGEAGLLGAAAVVGLTFVITGATAWSFASISTNIRIGAGGAFAVVSQSLGLEAGGAIGIPLYVAQALSVAFYMHGFSEAWLYIFPTHPRMLVLLAVYVGGFALSLTSEKLTLRSQVLVLVGVVVALGSMAAGLVTTPELQAPELHAPELLGDFGGAGFWSLFGIFFPAGTGIMVGASLSGKLRDPRRSISRGILSAWAVALVVYALMAVWYSVVASPAELRDIHQLVAVDRAAWPAGVLIGLMSSCLSAMLGSLVAAPNVLLALAQHKLVPWSGHLCKQSRAGTPRASVVVTGVIVGVALLVGDLNNVARLITTFFLLTYAIINVVVAVEQSLGMISFRPSLRAPLWVPLFGAASSVGVMLQADSALGLFALAVVIGMYVYFAVREVETPWETVRSGLVVALAHWVAEVVQRMEGPQYRAWKPDLLVPVTGASQLDGEFKLLSAIARGQGSVQVLAVVPPGKARSVAPRLSQAVHDFRRDELIASHVEIPSLDVVEAVRTSAAVLQTSMLRPNILFVNAAGRSEEELQQLDEVAVEERMGFVLLVPDGQAGLGRQRRVNVWIRFQESDWLTAVGKSNVDLLMLLGYQLEQNWNADLSLVTIAAPEDADRARQFLGKLKDEARLPGPVELCVARGSFPDALAAAPSADLNLFGLPDEIRKENLEQMATRLGATCLFVRDSGQESAFA